MDFIPRNMQKSPAAGEYIFLTMKFLLLVVLVLVLDSGMKFEDEDDQEHGRDGPS
jgi:hypothetical protein